MADKDRRKPTEAQKKSANHQGGLDSKVIREYDEQHGKNRGRRDGDRKG